jgi:hypothetical protein
MVTEERNGPVVEWGRDEVSRASAPPAVARVVLYQDSYAAAASPQETNMTSRFRVLASLLAPLTLVMAVPAAAGDVDTHFDRARGKPQVVRSPAGNTGEPAQAAASGSGAVAAAATQVKSCTCDTRK